MSDRETFDCEKSIAQAAEQVKQIMEYVRGEAQTQEAYAVERRLFMECMRFEKRRQIRGVGGQFRGDRHIESRSGALGASCRFAGSSVRWHRGVSRVVRSAGRVSKAPPRVTVSAREKRAPTGVLSGVSITRDQTSFPRETVVTAIPSAGATVTAVAAGRRTFTTPTWAAATTRLRNAAASSAGADTHQGNATRASRAGTGPIYCPSPSA